MLTWWIPIVGLLIGFTAITFGLVALLAPDSSRRGSAFALAVASVATVLGSVVTSAIFVVWIFADATP